MYNKQYKYNTVTIYGDNHETEETDLFRTTFV